MITASLSKTHHRACRPWCVPVWRRPRTRFRDVILLTITRCATEQPKEKKEKKKDTVDRQSGKEILITQQVGDQKLCRPVSCDGSNGTWKKSDRDVSHGSLPETVWPKAKLHTKAANRIPSLILKLWKFWFFDFSHPDRRELLMLKIFFAQPQITNKSETCGRP